MVDTKKAPKFNIGDVVQLKSGGHSMTVTDHQCLSELMLSWSHQGELQEAHLPEDALQLYDIKNDQKSGCAF